MRIAWFSSALLVGALSHVSRMRLSISIARGSLSDSAPKLVSRNCFSGSQSLGTRSSQLVSLNDAGAVFGAGVEPVACAKAKPPAAAAASKRAIQRVRVMSGPGCETVGERQAVGTPAGHQ